MMNFTQQGSRRAALRGLGALAALAACEPWAVAAPAGVVSDKLAITGAVAKPLTLDVEALKAAPADEIATLGMSRKVDDKDVASTVRGVRLTALLDRAALVEADHNTWKHTIVVATATDGYAVVFS